MLNRACAYVSSEKRVMMYTEAQPELCVRMYITQKGIKKSCTLMYFMINGVSSAFPFESLQSPCVPLLGHVVKLKRNKPLKKKHLFRY